MNVLTILFGLLFLIFLMAGLVLLAGVRAKARLKMNYPPPGDLIDVGGYKLHFHRQGDSGPSVILDAGAGEHATSWALVQPEAAKFARVYAYDRAGLGWSDPGPTPRTNQQMVEELHTLLHKAGVPVPYILVGASLGGLNARLYAHRYPDEVAGLVLVDAAHEEQYASEGMRQAFESIQKMMPRMYGMMRALVSSGLPALFPQSFKMLAPVSPNFPSESAQATFALRAADEKYFRAAEAELSAVPASHAQIREMQVDSLGDIPTVVLMHGKYEQMQTPDLTELNESTNRRLQPQVAAQSSNGKLIVAEHSGHNIPGEQPEIVVEAIREVIAMANRQSAPVPIDLVQTPDNERIPLPEPEKS